MVIGKLHLCPPTEISTFTDNKKGPKGANLYDHTRFAVLLLIHTEKYPMQLIVGQMKSCLGVWTRLSCGGRVSEHHCNHPEEDRLRLLEGEKGRISAAKSPPADWDFVPAQPVKRDGSCSGQ